MLHALGSNFYGHPALGDSAGFRLVIVTTDPPVGSEVLLLHPLVLHGASLVLTCGSQCQVLQGSNAVTSRALGIPLLNPQAQGPGTSGLWTAASWLGLGPSPAVAGSLTLDTFPHVVDFRFFLL